jgi:hypothetical protein
LSGTRVQNNSCQTATSNFPLVMNTDFMFPLKLDIYWRNIE